MSKKTGNLHGKTALITGATSGIGRITARELAAQGAQIVIAARNQKKAEETAQQIKAETGNQAVHYLVADFSDLDQVRKLAQTYRVEYSRLDILINNAGSFFNSRRKTQYGVEMTFLVNHLAPFLLTNLLLDTIKNSSPARIVNVSSDAHSMGRINFNDLEFKHFYFGILAYSRSKLANILFTYELNRRLQGSDVTVNALHPGHVTTNIWKNDFSIFGPLLKQITSLFALTPEEGADNTIFLAAYNEVEGISGKYFLKREPALSAKLSYDLTLARNLWAVSSEITSLSK